MNSKVKERVNDFSHYARQLLEEQELQLKAVKEEHLLSGKLARIKVFNAHMDILKEKLELHMEQVLQLSASLPEDHYNKLSAALTTVYSDCVSEYLCISFIKEKE